MSNKSFVPVLRFPVVLIFVVILCGAAFSQDGSNLLREDGLLAVKMAEDQWSSSEIYRSGNPKERFYQGVRISGTPALCLFWCGIRNR